MTEAWVVNASPLILFGRIGRLDLIDQLAPAGEAQVLANAVGHQRWAVLDDRAARRCAAAHGVTTIGSLGIVLRAKQRGRIEKARSLVQDLVAAGMFLDDEFMNRVLATVGE